MPVLQCAVRLGVGVVFVVVIDDCVALVGCRVLTRLYLMLACLVTRMFVCGAPEAAVELQLASTWETTSRRLTLRHDLAATSAGWHVCRVVRWLRLSLAQKRAVFPSILQLGWVRFVQQPIRLAVRAVDALLALLFENGTLLHVDMGTCTTRYAA